MEVGHDMMVNEEKTRPCVMGRRCLKTGSCAWVKETPTVNAGRDGIMPCDGGAERPCSPVCAVPEQGPGRGGPRSPRCGGPVVTRRGGFVSVAGLVETTHTAVWLGSHPPTLGKVQKRQERVLLGTGRKITDLVK